MKRTGFRLCSFYFAQVGDVFRQHLDKLMFIRLICYANLPIVGGEPSQTPKFLPRYPLSLAGFRDCQGEGWGRGGRALRHRRNPWATDALASGAGRNKMKLGYISVLVAYMTIRRGV